MGEIKKNLTVRIDSILLEKFRYLSTNDGRSANNQILILVRTCIEQYEAEHGEIKCSE